MKIIYKLQVKLSQKQHNQLKKLTERLNLDQSAVVRLALAKLALSELPHPPKRRATD